jgi:hypothetical protein
MTRTAWPLRGSGERTHVLNGSLLVFPRMRCCAGLPPHGLDMEFEVRPTGEPVTTSEGMLGIGEAPTRAPVPGNPQDVLRLLLQMIEIRQGWQALRHRSPFVAWRPLAGMKGLMLRC